MSLKVLISLQTSTSFPIHRFGSLLAALTHRPVCSTAYDTIRPVIHYRGLSRHEPSSFFSIW